MGRLIDADALKRHEQKIATQAWKMQVKASVETILNQFIDDIDHAPPVDAVEVVRCKDCKYWRDTDHTCRGHSLVSPMTADDFCSYGKKDGDHEKAD